MASVFSFLLCVFSILGPDAPAGQQTTGDPINIGGGFTYQMETDYTTFGPNALSFTRYFNSDEIHGFRLSYNWTATYDRLLHFISSTMVSALRDDGKYLAFVLTANGWVGPADLDMRLAQTGPTTWTLTDWDDTVETYTLVNGNLGRLITVQARNGYTQTLNYGDVQLNSVVDSYGRQLSFTYYNGTPYIHTVTTPDGLVLTYAQDANGRLTSVTYSTSPPTTRTFLYEGSNLYQLTGIIDENGNRFSSAVYDPNSGQVTASQYASGANAATIGYQLSHGNPVNTVTNAVGEQEIYYFSSFQAGNGIPEHAFICTEIDRTMPAALAASRFFTYDGNGYKASETDWNGNKTTYVNDARGLPLTITEAAGTPLQRVTNTTYLPNLHLPSQIAAPGLTATFTMMRMAKC